MQKNNRNEYLVPKSFLCSPFFKEDGLFSNYNGIDFEEILKKEPFYFDMLHVLGEELNEKPWMNPERTIPTVIEQWTKIMTSLHKAFTNREKGLQKEENMIHSISLFVISLYWANQKPVSSLLPAEMMISQLPLKPANCEERLSFIINKPSGYHSFIQLQQLFSEFEKMFSKSLAIKRFNHSKRIPPIE
ncbi:YpoC family protein [uncultured Metabacillus sp.]|uniref:YpoC family protein n=1 Tax=uncultured Metabacillus sp. TaxID=2860135 RepID=UPI0026045701|nr:hypothetical protein [uncultured Metabacillus sp.]